MDRKHPTYQRLHEAIVQHAFAAQELFAQIGRSVTLAKSLAESEGVGPEREMLAEIQATIPALKSHFDATSLEVDHALAHFVAIVCQEVEIDRIAATRSS